MSQDDDNDDDEASTCEILVIHPSNGEPACPTNMQLNLQNGCNPNETSGMGKLPAEADRPKKPKDWDTVSVSAIVELEMMKDDLERCMVDDLERFGRLLNLETNHNGRDNTTMVGEIEQLVPVLRQEIEDCEDGEDEPYINPPMSDPNELYEYWDISTGHLVWYPHLPKGCIEEEKTIPPNVEESMPSVAPCKVISKCPTLNSIQEEDENEDKVMSETEEVEQKQKKMDKQGVNQKSSETDKQNEEKEIEEMEGNHPLEAEPTCMVVTSGVANKPTNALDTCSKVDAAPMADRKSKSGESMYDTHASAEDSFSSGSSVTLYERTNSATVLKSSVDLTQETSEPDTMCTAISSQPVTDTSVNTASKETVPQMGSLYVELSDRQMTLSSFNPSSMMMSDDSYSPPCAISSNEIAVEESEKLEMNSAPVMPTQQLPCSLLDGEHVPADKKAHKVPVSAPTLVVSSCKSQAPVHVNTQIKCDKKVCNSPVCTPETESLAAGVEGIENQSEYFTEPSVSTKSFNTDSAAEQEKAVETLDEKEQIAHTKTTTKRASPGTEIAQKIEKLLAKVVHLRTVGNTTGMKFPMNKGSETQSFDEKLQAHQIAADTDSATPTNSPTIVQTDIHDQSMITKVVLSKSKLNFKECKAAIGRIPNPVRMKINFNDLIQQNCIANDTEESRVVTNTTLPQYFPSTVHHNQTLNLTGSSPTHDGGSALNQSYHCSRSEQVSQSNEDISIAESCTQSRLTAGDQTRCSASNPAVSTASSAHEQKQNTNDGKPASRKGSKGSRSKERIKSKNKKGSSEQQAHFQSKQSSVKTSGPVIKGKSSLPSKKYQRAVMKTKRSLGGSVLPSKLPTLNNRKKVTSFELPREDAVAVHQDTVKPFSKNGNASISQVSSTVGVAIPCQDTTEADLATKATNRPATSKYSRSGVTAATYSDTKHSDSTLKRVKKDHSDPHRKESKGNKIIKSEERTKEGSKKMTHLPTSPSKSVKMTRTELPLMQRKKSATAQISSNMEGAISSHSKVPTPQRNKSSPKLMPITEEVHKPAVGIGQLKTSRDDVQRKMCQHDMHSTISQCTLKDKKEILLLTALQKYSHDTNKTNHQHPQPQQSNTMSLPKIPLTSDGERYNATTRIKANRDRVLTETKLSFNSTSTPNTTPKEHLTGQTQYNYCGTTNLTGKTGERQTARQCSQLPPIIPQQTFSLPKLIPEGEPVSTPMGATGVSQMFEQCFKLPQLIPPEIYSLPKLEPTSDGQGLDATAWVKANSKRVKQIYAKYMATHCELDPSSMTEMVKKASNPIEEARANLNRKTATPPTAQLKTDGTQFHMCQKTKANGIVKVCQGDMQHVPVSNQRAKLETLKLSKLQLTSDGEGYDASAWIRENRHLILGKKTAEQPTIGVLQSNNHDDELTQIMKKEESSFSSMLNNIPHCH